MEIKVLGQLEISIDGTQIPLRGQRQRTLVTILALHAGQIVPTYKLIDAMWDAVPPRSAPVQVRRRISWLRQEIRSASGDDTVIETVAGGYLLRAEGVRVDACAFLRLLVEARAEVAAGRARTAAETLASALALWRGPVAGGADSLSYAPEVVRLDQDRRAAAEEYIELRLRTGAHRHIVGELSALVAQDPLNEKLRAHLMVALYRSGRQADAMEIYREGRRLLAEELGVEPNPGLRDLANRILNADPDLDPPGHRTRRLARVA